MARVGQPRDDVLVGTWDKVPGADCGDQYPVSLEIAESTYLGRRGADQSFVVWDAGIWRHDEPGRLVISTASDELVGYDYSVSDATLTFADASGCQVSYQRRT